MRIAIDMTSLLPQATGVDNYIIGLVSHLARIDQTNRYWLFTNFEDRHLFSGKLPDNYSLVSLSFRPRLFRLFFQQILLPLFARICYADVVHSPSFLIPFWRGRQRHLLMIHDMTFFSLPDCHIPLRRSAAFQRAVKESIRRADLVTVPSRATHQAILDVMPDVSPDHIRVIPLGVSNEFRPRPQEEVQRVIRRLGLPTPYILYVGTIEPRKNLSRLVESYRKMITEHEVAEHLVLAGRLGWDYEALLKQIAAPELRGRVVLTGYVAQKDLPHLYCGAQLFAYPSLQEGFGFPPLEAMACGVPTITSSSSSLAENLRDAVEMVAPEDESALASAMWRLLSNENLRASLREKGLERASQFQWDETSRQTLECFRTLTERHADI